MPKRDKTCRSFADSTIYKKPQEQVTEKTGYWKASRANKIVAGIHDRQIFPRDFPKEIFDQKNKTLTSHISRSGRQNCSNLT